MSAALRIILIAVSLLLMIYILRRIRKSKLQIEYSLFWIFFSFLLFILSIFPGIAFFFSKLCGIQSPVNFIFLIMIFILLIHGFYMTIKSSELENKIKDLTQELAVRDKLKEEEIQKNAGMEDNKSKDTKLKRTDMNDKKRTDPVEKP